MSRYAQPHAHLRAAPVTGAAEAVSQVAIALRRRPARKSRDTHWLRFHCGDTYTGAGGDPGIANMWNRKEISVIVPRRTGHPAITHQYQEVGLVRRRLAAHAHGGTQHMPNWIETQGNLSRSAEIPLRGYALRLAEIPARLHRLCVWGGVLVPSG